MPKVSVIIPMYNAARSAQYSIDAVLAQTMSDLEVIAVDDCSTDGGYELCLERYRDEKRVVLLKLDRNQGPGAARNAALKIARGEYVTFLDSDDGMIRDAVAALYSAAVRYDADVVHTTGCYYPVHRPDVYDMMSVPEDRYIRKDKDRNPVSETTVLSGDTAERVSHYIRGEYNVNVWGKLFRRSFLAENHIVFADLKMSEDTVFSLECLMKAGTYVILPYRCILYRIIGDSLSRGTKTPAFLAKVLDALFGGNAALAERLADVPFFVKNPEYEEKLLEYLSSVMDMYYVVPTYQTVGKDAVMRDKDIGRVFDRYFGPQAFWVRTYFFDRLDRAEKVFDMSGSSPTYEQGIALLEKQRRGND